MCPSAIVGPCTGPVPAASLFWKFVAQFPLASKKANYIGEGSNLFYTVRVTPSALHFFSPPAHTPNRVMSPVLF